MPGGAASATRREGGYLGPAVWPRSAPLSPALTGAPALCVAANLTIRSTNEIGVVELVFADLTPQRRLCMDKFGKLKGMVSKHRVSPRPVPAHVQNVPPKGKGEASERLEGGQPSQGNACLPRG